MNFTNPTAELRRGRCRRLLNELLLWRELMLRRRRRLMVVLGAVVQLIVHGVVQRHRMHHFVLRRRDRRRRRVVVLVRDRTGARVTTHAWKEMENDEGVLPCVGIGGMPMPYTLGGWSDDVFRLAALAGASGSNSLAASALSESLVADFGG